MAPTSSKLVVFDLDGTLVDTGADLVDSLNHTIGTTGIDPVALADLDHLVGQGAHAMIARALLLRGQERSQQELDALFHLFLAHYEAGMPGKSKLFAGLADAMDRLDAAGFDMAICTNKSEKLSRSLLSALGVDKRFRAIVGGDTLAFRKPDARHVLSTIEKAGGKPAGSVMIGDSINDIEAAKAANVASIGVPFGYSDVPVHDLRPDRVIAHFDELTPAMVDDLLFTRKSP